MRGWHVAWNANLSVELVMLGNEVIATLNRYLTSGT